MTSIPNDDHRQLSRLIEERNAWYDEDRSLWKLMIKIMGFSFVAFLLNYFFTPPSTYKQIIGIILASLVSTGLSTLYVYKRWIFKKPIFVCPNTRCRGEASALHWQCSCGKVHALENYQWLRGTETLPKVIGEACDACGNISSHYTCKHCHTNILINATHTRMKPAVFPGYVRPPREPEEERIPVPLKSFDDLDP